MIRFMLTWSFTKHYIILWCFFFADVQLDQQKMLINNKNFIFFCHWKIFSSLPFQIPFIFPSGYDSTIALLLSIRFIIFYDSWMQHLCKLFAIKIYNGHFASFVPHQNPCCSINDEHFVWEINFWIYCKYQLCIQKAQSEYWKGSVFFNPHQKKNTKKCHIVKDICILTLLIFDLSTYLSLSHSVYDSNTQPKSNPFKLQIVESLPKRVSTHWDTTPFCITFLV